MHVEKTDRILTRQSDDQSQIHRFFLDGLSSLDRISLVSVWPLNSLDCIRIDGTDESVSAQDSVFEGSFDSARRVKGKVDV